MVKITEELWDKYDQEVRRLCNDNYFNLQEVDYYLEVMKRVTGKHANSIMLHDPMNTTSEGAKMYSSFYEEIAKSHNLLAGYNTIIATNGSITVTPIGIDNCEGNSPVDRKDFKVCPLMLFGDDLVVVLGKSRYTDTETDDIVGVISGHMILYTSDSAQEALSILNDIEDFKEKLPKPAPVPDNSIVVKFAYRSDCGLNINRRVVEVPNISLEEFNDDLPNEKIDEEIGKKGAGLFIFHGEPGCGKSSYIKYLIKKYKDKDFIIVSQDIILGSMDSFREFLLVKCKNNSIIIIEDCENLVKSRESVGSSVVISDFLNMTDGIYGDMFGIKFILTFNTEIKEIDSALLRKGRLKFKYRFTKLKGERLKNLASKLGIELKESQLTTGLSLADLYNYDSDTGYSGQDKKSRSIGFNS